MLVDQTILAPIAILGPDFTALEWAQRLDVPLDQVMEAFDILQIKPKIEPLHPDAEKKLIVSEQIIQALKQGCHRVNDIAARVKLHPQTVRSKLNLLRKHGVVTLAGKGPYQRWVLNA